MNMLPSPYFYANVEGELIRFDNNADNCFWQRGNAKTKGQLETSKS